VVAGRDLKRCADSSIFRLFPGCCPATGPRPKNPRRSLPTGAAVWTYHLGDVALVRNLAPGQPASGPHFCSARVGPGVRTAVAPRARDRKQASDSDASDPITRCVPSGDANRALPRTTTWTTSHSPPLSGRCSPR
jgi:hypothetical protein